MRFISGGIVFEPLKPGEMGHRLQNLVEVCCGNKFSVGFSGGVLAVYHFGRFGRYAPIAVFVFAYDARFVGIFFSDMFHPLLHRRIVSAYRLDIAELSV